MGRMQLKLKNWPFDKGIKAQLIWIGEPFKYQNKWMIDTYFNDGKSTKKVIQDWANIHFLSIDKYYIDGDLKSGKLIDKENKTKVIDIDLSGITPKYNENDWRIKGTDCRSKSRTYNFYKNNKLYTIPIIEIVRSVLAPNTFMLNNILYNNTFEDYFTYEINDEILKLYFNGSYKTSNLKDTYFNHFAWIISNRNVLNMVERIGYNNCFKHKMMFDFNMKHFKFTARVKENKAGYTILEIIKLKEKRINFNEIQVFHPSLEEYEKSDGSKKWTYINVNRNKGDKRVIDNELDGANKMTESIENDFIMHEYVKLPEIHRQKTGHANKHTKVDEQTKIYFKNDDNNRTFADEGGFNTGAGIDVSNIDLKYSKLSGELQDFINVLQQLRKMDGIKSVDINIIFVPLGRKFSHLKDGINRRRCIIGRILKTNREMIGIIEVEREGKALSTLIVKSNNKMIKNIVYDELLEGLIFESGKWSNKKINKLKIKGIKIERVIHSGKYCNINNIIKKIQVF